MSTWGAAIPGLGMCADELPTIRGLLRLENPEIGSGSTHPGNYTLEDLAEAHTRALQSLAWDPGRTPTIIGMSMGGMILSIIATRFRHLLPDACQFRFLVTSANTPSKRAIPEDLLADWRTVTPGSKADFQRIMEPFFSPEFIRSNPSAADAYFLYRATGKNRQTPRAFMRQVSAIQRFEGQTYFSALNPSECLLVGGGSDHILGPSHDALIRALSPQTRYMDLPGVGHMINLELPAAFEYPFPQGATA